MNQRKKQKTIIETWTTKQDDNNAGPSGLSSNKNQWAYPNIEPITIDSDNEKFENLPSDDDQMLAMALEISMKEYKAQNRTSEIGSVYQQDARNGSVSYLDLPGTSGFQNLPKQIPRENLAGFDLEAGSSWIYPTNYSLREYQFNIVQAALFKNTMVVLPTGLGKTFIAAVIMYNFYRWYPQGKVVFMAPTRPLVNQQIEACFKIMGIPQEHTEVLLGSDAPEKRKIKWLCKRVFFLTPQVIMNDISRGVCPIDLLKCLVVDEAHKAQGNHAYCEVIKGLLQASKSQFRVIGLSATPGGDMEAVKNVLSNLLISHVELRSEDSPDITPYTHTRTIRKEVVKMDAELLSIKEKFIKILKYILVKLEQKRAINKNVNPESLTQFGMVKMREAFQNNPPENLTKRDLDAIMREFLITITLYHAFDLLCAHGTRTFYKYLKGNITESVAQDRVRTFLENNQDFIEILKLLEKKHETNVVNGKFPYGHPKLKKLEEIVLNHFQNTEDVESTRVMIFSNYRESVEEIVEMLKNHEPIVRAMAFVGQNSKNSKGISQKVQLQVVNNFRAGGYNTLVSTCVGEEGLDIGEIDLIICYDAHKSPIRLVQRIGRTGRKRDGAVVSLVTEGKEDLKYNQGQYKKRSIDSALTSQALVKYLHSGCPRMVPLGINPVCLKMHMTVSQYQSKLSKISKKGDKTPMVKNHSISNMFDKLNATNKKRVESSYLTDAEHLNWSRKYKTTDDEIPLLPKSKFLSIPNSENSYNENENNNPISLSKWTPWQTTRNRTFFTSNSKRTDILVEMMQYIETQFSLPIELFSLEDFPKPKNVSVKNSKRKQISEESDTTIPPCEKVKNKLKKKPVFMWSESSGDESCDMSEVLANMNKIPMKTVNKNYHNAIVPNIQPTSPIAPETEPFIVCSSPPIVTEKEQLIRFSLSSRHFLKTPPSLDFELKFPLSPVDLDEIFPRKHTDGSIKESENSDDGYNSDDEKFTFLQFSKLKPFMPIHHHENILLKASDIQNGELLNENSMELQSFKIPIIKNKIEMDDNHVPNRNDHFDTADIIGTHGPRIKDNFNFVYNSDIYKPRIKSNFYSIEKNYNHDASKKDNFVLKSDTDHSPRIKDCSDIVEKTVIHEPRIKDSFDSAFERYTHEPRMKDCSFIVRKNEIHEPRVTDNFDSADRSYNHEPKIKENFDTVYKNNICDISKDDVIANFELEFEDDDIFNSIDDNKLNGNLNSDREIDLPMPSFSHQASLSSTPKSQFKEIAVKNTSLSKSNNRSELNSKNVSVQLSMICKEQKVGDKTKLKITNSLNLSNVDFQNQSDVVGLTQMINYVNQSSVKSHSFGKNNFPPIKHISNAKDKAVSNLDMVVGKSIPVERTIANFDLELDLSCDGFSPTEEDIFKSNIKQSLNINQSSNQLNGVTSKRVVANFDLGVGSSDEDLFAEKWPKDISKLNQHHDTNPTSDETDSPIRVKRKRSAVLKDDSFSNDLPAEPTSKIPKSGNDSQHYKHFLGKKKKYDVKEFLDVEANVSGNLSSSDESESVKDSYDKSFVNDSEESLNDKSPESMKGLYIKTTKDAIVKGNKFKLQFNPTNGDSMIFSQFVESDFSDYELDSFCVGNNNVSDDDETPVKVSKNSSKKKSSNNVPRKRIVSLDNSSSDDEIHFIKPNNKHNSKYFSKEKSVSKESSITLGWQRKESVSNFSHYTANKSPTKLQDFSKPSTSGHKFLSCQSQQNSAEFNNLNEKGCKDDYSSLVSASSSFKEMVQPEGKNLVFVDSKELAPSRLIISTLRDIHHIHVIILPMKGANYVISSKIGVYRAASTDFLNGSNKNKIEKILQTMHDYFEKTYLILETSRSNAPNPIKSRTLYADTLLNNVFNSGIKVFYSETQNSSAKILADIVYQEKRMKLQDYKIACKLSKEKEELLQFYATLPYVNHGIALNLVLRFNNLSQFLNCSIKEIEEKGEISQSLAKKIHFVINDHNINY